MEAAAVQAPVVPSLSLQVRDGKTFLVAPHAIASVQRMIMKTCNGGANQALFLEAEAAFVCEAGMILALAQSATEPLPVTGLGLTIPQRVSRPLPFWQGQKTVDLRLDLSDGTADVIQMSIPFARAFAKALLLKCGPE